MSKLFRNISKHFRIMIIIDLHHRRGHLTQGAIPVKKKNYLARIHLTAPGLMLCGSLPFRYTQDSINEKRISASVIIVIYINDLDENNKFAGSRKITVVDGEEDWHRI